MVSIFQEGSLTTVSGNMGSGKSDFSNMLSYLALKQGYHILSNIHLDYDNSVKELIKFESEFLNSEDIKNLLTGIRLVKNHKSIDDMLKRYHVIHNDIEFLCEVIKHKKNILILDETNLFYTSKRALTNDAVLFEMFISTIRKFYCSMILVIQRYGNFPPMARELSFCNISKITIKEGLFEIYPVGKCFTVVNIPKSPIRFETHSFSGFDFLLDWYKLISDIKNLSDNEVLSFLKKHAKTNFIQYMYYEK
jgi:hypothetical protein